MVSSSMKSWPLLILAIDLTSEQSSDAAGRTLRISVAPFCSNNTSAHEVGAHPSAAPDVTERNQPMLRFVPQHKPHAPKALQQRQPADAAQFRVVAQRSRQPVIGDTAAQVMDVMYADIRRWPFPPARGKQFQNTCTSGRSLSKIAHSGHERAVPQATDLKASRNKKGGIRLPRRCNWRRS
jgi:hypothetical protein